MTAETVVRGGLVATADATCRADIGISNGRISAIADRVEAASVIDVDGCIVVPGAIDVHTHFDTQLGDSRTADDLHLTQVVDGRQGVHGSVERRILGGDARLRSARRG